MFKIIRFNCCGLDVHKTWIYACIGITDANFRTEYFEARFSSFPKDLRQLAAWLQKYGCTEVCMESSGKYWIPVFNALETSCKVTLAHPKYTKPQKGNKTDRKDARWIIDAKYYAHNLQSQYDAYSIHSGNLYQIFTYVKNKTAELNDTNKNVSGMLLYAKTDEMEQPSGTYKMTGNTISVGTLDLNCDFGGISSQLNSLAKKHLGVA